jgi:uncharacterized protein YndB with AHSA1/START domain
VGLTDYHFDEIWTLDAPPEAVWDFVADPRTYPAWWREFRDVARLNELEGVGARVVVHVKAALPYHMRFELESTVYDRPHVAAVRVRGDLNGWMRWTLATAPGGGTRARFEEQVRTGRALLAVFAPVARPLFAWNHSRMMVTGEAALRRALLAAPPS